MKDSMGREERSIANEMPNALQQSVHAVVLSRLHGAVDHDTRAAAGGQG